ncbi:hypothetical protein BGZ68_007363 [Mortierella alpina]|nr:hypothetical protein BGZ68_007363 [Mortierella alpina]
MARSILLAFLVLAVIQMVWAQTLKGTYIVNVAAKGVLKGYPGMQPSVKPKDLSGPYRTWFITMVGDSKVTLSLAPEQEFLTFVGEELVVADVPHKFLLYAEKGLIIIKSSVGKDLYLTWDKKTERVTLKPFTDKPEQWWQLRNPKSTGYNQLNIQD